MTAAEAQSRQQVRLWSAAFGVSALVNLIVVLLIAVWISFRVVLAVIQYVVLSALGFEPASLFAQNEAPPPPPPMESVAMIVPEMVPAEVAPPKPPEAPFARTSKDQEADRPEKPAFIGDRNTQARSDAPAVAEAPLMPSQKGREPHFEDEVETTNSNYQDGDLASDHIAKPSAEPSIPSAPAPEPLKTPEAPESTPSPETAASEPSPPVEAKAGTPEAPAPRGPATPPPAPEPREKLAEGAMPVDRQVKEEAPPEPLKPKVPERAASSPAEEVAETPPPKARPQSAPASPADSPGFRGNQQKTRLSGSITRQGGSALDVEESLLGRYHSALSRAVEKEWQLNCVRNRDYITPGQIVVRFVLESSGKVRSLSFVEEFGVGNIQKGFTSESIRTAAIPAFPAELKKQLNGEPLEVTYSFTF